MKMQHLLRVLKAGGVDPCVLSDRIVNGRQMSRAFGSPFLLVASWALLTAPVVFGQVSRDQQNIRDQQNKELALANTLREALACKAEASGELYCHVEFRGLRAEFAGPNRRDGSAAIYVNSMGRNQTVSARFGGRCITVAFGDDDLRGPHISAEIIMRDDATFHHTAKNPAVWKTCRD